MTIDTKMADAVLKRIDQAEVVELALRLANIESPPGYEREAGDAVYDWLVEHGFAAKRIGMFEDRFNVFAELPGHRRGPSLAFNSHLDTWMSREDTLIFRDLDKPDYLSSWEEGDLLMGNPVVNDKGPMASFMIAAKALHEAGVELSGSVYLTMVPGEIGQEPVDEFQGPKYLSKEVGARYLINHSPRASYCVVAEATEFRKGWVEAGKAFHKITVYGLRARYTPYLARPFTTEEQPNAIIRAIPLLERLEEWALAYEGRHRYEGPGGTVVPRVNIGAVRSGQPWMLLQNPELCEIYLDIRTVPEQDSGEIAHELRELLDELGLEGKVEQFLNRPSYEAKGIEPLSEALDEAHRIEFGEQCEIAKPEETSMWRDHLLFNEVGIPALTYGPAGSAGPGIFAVRKEDLERAARVYALTALAVCGDARG
jgi:acetylornithine deacetylase/succinyl-diaminopimelate desuccinylase-like protein